MEVSKETKKFELTDIFSFWASVLTLHTHQKSNTFLGSAISPVYPITKIWLSSKRLLVHLEIVKKICGSSLLNPIDRAWEPKIKYLVKRKIFPLIVISVGHLMYIHAFINTKMEVRNVNCSKQTGD